MRLLFLFLLMLFVTPAFAHESADLQYPHVHSIPVAVERNIVNITQEDGYRIIRSNGIPNHKTGEFPNRDNPNSIQVNHQQFRMPVNPGKSSVPREKRGVIGVALNGILFEPGTAECYGRGRGERGPVGVCEWREEAIVNGKGKLGLDNSNAHVQPEGTYHYHGIPYGLLDYLSADDDLVHVGYAADGFKLMVSLSGVYKSGYVLKDGIRPSGPGGRYDGTYTADFEFNKGAGDLDECNGVDIDGQYVYFITAEFPFAPRCLMGETVDSSFDKHREPTFRSPGPHGIPANRHGNDGPPPRRQPPRF